MIIYGKQLFLHLLKNYPSHIETVFLSKKCDPKLFSQIARVTNKICSIDERKAQAMSHGGNHQGFIAEIKDIPLADRVNRLNDMREYLESEISAQVNVIRSELGNNSRSDLHNVMMTAIERTFEVFEVTV